MKLDLPPVSANGVVVLERIARGGGATNWFFCRHSQELEVVVDKLKPGSVVSFYFDGRIQRGAYSPAIAEAIREIIARDRAAVVGVLAADGVNLDVDFPGAMDEVAEFLSDHDPASVVFYGAFPARDDDGARAVTVTVPDADGIVRGHPH